MSGSGEVSNPQHLPSMIEHTVTFSLRHPRGSAEEHAFLLAATELASLPGVRDFSIRRQVSPKHPHAFGITMRFATQAEYEAYNDHPLHAAFVKERWLEEVTDFQEADFLESDDLAAASSEASASAEG